MAPRSPIRHSVQQPNGQFLFSENIFSQMEALKMKLFFVVVTMLIMAASAADSPAPSPTSDTTMLFVPTVVASLVALAFGLLF
ncbi:hypothetical protein VNO78_33151 [Psophocarpus tetragonolobus]|uniref:Uncharacterized protein n=1 Tax=Psophocarpus tetragonolobus TaxID=3891 RepID=A0AAN9NWR8_PSOTE